ncbi:protein stunted-like isoform X2 [Sipha flava]|uniref:Protein stunted-like isoform X2 n=1 Tax=Sipha flava TaxID=143950 RepID=A0A8B8FAU3_9HEMI|nr:protein stunted-like isoform X2 [Sipha flava]
MSYWRAAGLNYVNYSNIAAKIVRRVLKPELQSNASKRDETHVKFTPWIKGKPANEKA